MCCPTFATTAAARFRLGTCHDQPLTSDCTPRYAHNIRKCCKTAHMRTYRYVNFSKAPRLDGKVPESALVPSSLRMQNTEQHSQPHICVEEWVLKHSHDMYSGSIRNAEPRGLVSTLGRTFVRLINHWWPAAHQAACCRNASMLKNYKLLFLYGCGAGWASWVAL